VADVRRLSIIVSVLPQGSLAAASAGQGMLSGRALAERAVRGILDQPDPIGAEIVVVAPFTRGATTLPEYLRSAFPDEFRDGRLHAAEVEANPPTSARLRNGGARLASGSTLAFLDSPSLWPPEGLARLESRLKGSDRHFAVREDTAESSDWVRTLLAHPRALLPNTVVVRRQLFDDLGGFKECWSAALTSALPGASPLGDLDFVLRALVRLQETGARRRVDVERRREEGATAEGAEQMLPVAGLLKKAAAVGEAVTLLGTTRAVPARYWSEMGKAFLEAGKRVFRRS
jgi:hypothetical protein